MKIEQIRSMPRTTQWEWTALAQECERFLLNPQNSLEERLEAGQILHETQGIGDEVFTERDLRQYGGISGPRFLQEFGRK